MEAKKVTALVLCAILLVVGSVTGTMAYLNDTSEVVTNTFTVGKVNIKLDEAKVDEYGVKDGDTRVESNTYKLIPGHTYVKDPTVYVKGDSEPCYVRVKVTLSDTASLNNVFPGNESNGVFLLQNFVDGWNSDVWQYKNYDNGIYEFRYRDKVTIPAGTNADAYVALVPLFTSITIPSDVDGDDLEKLADSFNIEVVAHAIQADSFANADAAWTAFDAPTNP